jgi:hypothetical protein
MYCNFDATGVDESKRILKRLEIVLTNHVKLLHAQWALQEHSHQTLKFCGVRTRRTLVQEPQARLVVLDQIPVAWRLLDKPLAKPTHQLSHTRAETVIDGLRGRKKLGFRIQKRDSLLMRLFIQQEAPLVPSLDSASQALFPKAAHAILLAPLLHHPRLELVSDSLPLVDLWRRILLLSASGLGLVL